ncbi:MAG: YigZ family protein [Clostridia bacterium]|nr:YigZ family protein [Clostridia bacterium]
MGDYKTIDAISEGFYTEKHSKFYATLYPCKSEEEAAKILTEHRAKYFDARHNVYAYILKDNTARFSDDGEPHGTAAKPILDILSHSEIVDAIIIVTRYFGGILLGTGGLVRAYSAAAKEAIDNANAVNMVECDIFSLSLPYSDQNRIMSLLSDMGAAIINTEFAEKVTVKFYLITPKTREFNEKLCEISSGKLSADKIKTEILPIKEQK